MFSYFALGRRYNYVRKAANLLPFKEMTDELKTSSWSDVFNERVEIIELVFCHNVNMNRRPAFDVRVRPYYVLCEIYPYDLRFEVSAIESTDCLRQRTLQRLRLVEVLLKASFAPIVSRFAFCDYNSVVVLCKNIDFLLRCAAVRTLIRDGESRPAKLRIAHSVQQAPSSVFEAGIVRFSASNTNHPAPTAVNDPAV